LMSFTERIQSPEDLKHVKGEMPVNFLYTAGIAGERFLREIKENAKILGVRCRKCHIVHVPPKIYCERCFERLGDWTELACEGQIETFTTCYFDADGNRLAEPEIFAVIRLRGANEGIIHKVQEIRDRDVHVGMEVKAVFREKKDRIGSVLDIAYFEPIAP